MEDVNLIKTRLSPHFIPDGSLGSSYNRADTRQMDAELENVLNGL